MIYGTHNTMSYLRPKNILMYIGYPFAQCQTLSLEQQIELGCEYFDFRVRYNDNEVLRFFHGGCEFKSKHTVLYYLDILEEQAQKLRKKFYVRFWYENNIDNLSDYVKNRFNHECEVIGKMYKNLIFEFGFKTPYKYSDKNWGKRLVEINEHMTWYNILLTPRFWAKKHEPKKFADLQGQDILVSMDFVEYVIKKEVR